MLSHDLSSFHELFANSDFRSGSIERSDVALTDSATDSSSYIRVKRDYMPHWEKAHLSDEVWVFSNGSAGLKPYLQTFLHREAVVDRHHPMWRSPDRKSPNTSFALPHLPLATYFPPFSPQAKLFAEQQFKRKSMASSSLPSPHARSLSILTRLPGYHNQLQTASLSWLSIADAFGLGTHEIAILCSLLREQNEMDRFFAGIKKSRSPEDPWPEMKGTTFSSDTIKLCFDDSFEGSTPSKSTSFCAPSACNSCCEKQGSGASPIPHVESNTQCKYETTDETLIFCQVPTPEEMSIGYNGIEENHRASLECDTFFDTESTISDTSSTLTLPVETSASCTVPYSGLSPIFGDSGGEQDEVNVPLMNRERGRTGDRRTSGHRKSSSQLRFKGLEDTAQKSSVTLNSLGWTSQSSALAIGHDGSRPSDDDVRSDGRGRSKTLRPLRKHSHYSSNAVPQSIPGLTSSPVVPPGVTPRKQGSNFSLLRRLSINTGKIKRSSGPNTPRSPLSMSVPVPPPDGFVPDDYFAGTERENMGQVDPAGQPHD